MGILIRFKAPEAIGTEMERYNWDATHHHHLVLNLVLFLVALACSWGIAAYYDYVPFGSEVPLISKIVLVLILVWALLLFLRALRELLRINIRIVAIVGDKGFCIYQFNVVRQRILSRYLQTYATLDHIEKYEHNRVSEEGVYLGTVAHYTFHAADGRKVRFKLVYHSNDVRLTRRRGLGDVKAMRAIDIAYNNSRTSEVPEITTDRVVVPCKDLFHRYAARLAMFSPFKLVSGLERRWNTLRLFDE